LIDESFGNNFSANEEVKTYDAGDPYDQVGSNATAQNEPNKSQVLQIVQVAKQFLSGVKNEQRSLYKPLIIGSSLSNLGQDLVEKQSKKQLMKGVFGQVADQTQSMISLFNQLMIHQILYKKLYEQ
jgi:hypothetical protein